MGKATTTKHTRGPWFLFGNNHCVGGPLEGGDNAGIAMCSMRLRSEAENEANARLISAAPDLLEVLREWVDYFDELERHADPDDPLADARRMYHGKRVEKSRAALAKAKEAPTP